MNTYLTSKESISAVGRDPRNTFYSRGLINGRAAMKAVPGEKINLAEDLYGPGGAAVEGPEYNVIDKLLYFTGMLCVIIVCSLIFIL